MRVKFEEQKENIKSKINDYCFSNYENGNLIKNSSSEINNSELQIQNESNEYIELNRHQTESRKLSSDSESLKRLLVRDSLSKPYSNE